MPEIDVHPNWRIVLFYGQIWIQYGWVVDEPIRWWGMTSTVKSVRDPSRIQNAGRPQMNVALFRSEATARDEIRDRIAQEVR